MSSKANPFVILTAVALGLGGGLYFSHQSPSAPLAVLSPTQANSRFHSPNASNVSIEIKDEEDSLSERERTGLRDMVSKQLLFHQHQTQIPNPLTLRIKLFKREADYLAYQREHSKTTSPKGYYSTRRKELVVNKSRQTYGKTLKHEAQHFLLRLNGFSRPPRWINEGLSECFEEMSIDASNKAWMHRQDWRMKRLQGWQAQGQLPSVSDFVNWSRDTWSTSGKKTPYLNQSMAWALVYFLMETPTGRYTLIQTLKDLRAKKYDGNSARIIDAYYPLNALERDFNTFLEAIPTRLPFRFDGPEEGLFPASSR